MVLVLNSSPIDPWSAGILVATSITPHTRLAHQLQFSLGLVGMNLHLQTSVPKSKVHARRTSGESQRWGVPNLALNPDAASTGGFLLLSSRIPIPYQRAAVGRAG